MPAADCLLEARDLTVARQGEVLLRQVGFAVPRGDRFVILGPSGCGKTTLLRHLVGLEPPAGGEIRLAATAREGLKPGAPGFGVLFQSGGLLGSLTVLENILLPLRQWTRLPAPAAAELALARLGLVGLRAAAHLLPAALSGGMLRRAGIARALALEPPLLFLDEPAAGLDPLTAAALDELLVELNERLGVTLVLVTHELDCIFRVGLNCVMLDRQRQGIAARGDPRRLREEAADPLVRAFLNRGRLPEQARKDGEA